MENNFFVGVVFHGRKSFKVEYTEKLVLYSDDNFNYLDLINDVYYTTDENNKDYVIKESLVPTDILEYREDYLYMLSRHNDSRVSRRKIKLDI